MADHADHASTYTASSPCVAQGKCTAGQRVDPGLAVSSINVPLIAPNIEFGDRINQLDFNVSKAIKAGRYTIQPKFDLFNALNVSPVYAVRNAAGSATTAGALLYGIASHMQPQSILNGRVFQSEPTKF